MAGDVKGRGREKERDMKTWSEWLVTCAHLPLQEELDGMIKKKSEVEKELATEKAKKADELKEKLDVSTLRIAELEQKTRDIEQLKTDVSCRVNSVGKRM